MKNLLYVRYSSDLYQILSYCQGLFCTTGEIKNCDSVTILFPFPCHAHPDSTAVRFWKFRERPVFQLVHTYSLLAFEKGISSAWIQSTENN